MYLESRKKRPNPFVFLWTIYIINKTTMTKKEKDCNLFNARLKGRLHDIPDNILVLI